MAGKKLNAEIVSAINEKPEIEQKVQKESVIFVGSGVVYHGGKRFCEFNKNYLLETDDNHIISTLRKRGYKEIDRKDLTQFSKHPQDWLYDKKIQDGLTEVNEEELLKKGK